MQEKLLSYALLMICLFSNMSQTLFAFETEVFHNLDELPFAETIETSDMRRSLLDAEVGQSEVPSISPETIQEENPPVISLSLEDVSSETLVSLLAEKRIFEKNTVNNFTGFIIDPFTMTDLSGSVLLTKFFSQIPIQTGAIDISSTRSDIDIELPKKTGKRIEVTSGARKKKNLSSINGGVSYEFMSGTIITSASGETIDTASIGLEVLPATKKMKAKLLYEKKMKNRGNLRKGQSQAQVSGFEFGLSGTHLLFSKPVKLTIETPNMTEGNVVDLLTFHKGDTDFHTGGLSVSSSSLCNTDGSASIPGSEAIVKNGKITFYTCGASSFTMNPSGGTAGSNDLRAIIGDCGQIQLYYNNLTQIYTGNPPATGCTGTPSVWPTLRIGATTYGNGFTAWTSATTTGSTSGNTYTANSTMRATVGGLNYDLIIDWSHTAPNKFLTWSWRVIVPATNTNNVRFYYGMDSFVAGADANDVGYFTNTGGQTFGIYDNVANIVSAFRYLSGSLWTAYEAGPYTNINTRIAGGTDFNNTIQGTPGDLGFGANWNLGTTPGTYSGSVEWRLAPYVAANVPDLIPGIGLPEGPLTTSLTSEMPITVSNIGNLASSGVHTVILTIPTNITGPASAFTNNGWSCGAQVGTGVTCTKTTTISAPTGVDTVRIPVTPTLAASGTSVTFNVRITNPGDSNLTNNTAFAINAVVGGAPPNDPGGVGTENLWLRANSGTNCTITGCTITTWTNQGGLGVAANAVTGIGIVTYDPVTRINGYPTLYFNNASLNTNNNLGLPTVANSIFAVTRIGAGGTFRLGTQTATANTRQWSTSPTTDIWMRFTSTIFYSGANLRAANTPAITTTVRQVAGASAGFTNGRSLLTSANATAFTVNNFGIGINGTTTSTLSNVAEVIVYPSAITATQQKQVESYLALKYGITLDQTTATNYLGSNGTVIWNAGSGGVYNKNIAGIIRDDTSALNHLTSQSVTSAADIIVSRPFIANNRYALIWGNDNASTTAFTGTDAAFGYERITREWQFQERVGDLGDVTVSYPVASVPAGFTGTLLLLLDNDGVFATGSTVYTGTLNAGNWDFSLNIANMQYITFAKSVPTDITPPTITSNSVASGTLAPHGTFPITITYTDTGSAIAPATLTGRIYAWDATGSTWSPTNIAAGYLSITSISSSTGVFQLSNLPFGKYRFDFLISDTLGNTRTESYTYYIDAVEWTISAPLFDIGNIPLSTTTFGSGELILTVRTIGAGFNLTMLRMTDLTYISDVIPVYSGSTGWGYDKNIGAGYSATLTGHATTQTLVTVPKNVNTNGQKNTFTYRVKYGVNPDANTPTGDYAGMMRFGINLTY